METQTQVLEARNAMGTRFEIALPGEDRVRLQAVAEEVLDEVDRLESQLSLYRASSELSGINAFAAERPVRVEPRLFALLRLALDVSQATDGAFDPTIVPLLRAWGFVGGRGKVAAPEEIAAAREVTGWRLVELDEDAFTVRFLRQGVSLDFGAIGKGYAIDRALELMEDAEVTSALLHGGTSTVLGLGPAPDGEPWRVALRDPRGGEQDLLGEVRLRDRSLSVSGPHNKAFREGSRLYGHVLDPRTGEPTQGGVLAAVAHGSATLTDALSTALLVLGREGAPALSQRFPDADLLLITEEEGGLRAWTGGPDQWNLQLRQE